MVYRKFATAILFACCLTIGIVYADGSLVPYPDTSAAPELELRDINNQLHQLSDYQGKVVLVNFWASWCIPCVMEMPGMQRLADTLKDQPFEILAVNVADTENRIHEFIKRMDLHLTVLMDHDGKTFKAWQGKVLPASFLLDRSGRIRYRVIGPLEWDSDAAVAIIEQLLQQP